MVRVLVAGILTIGLLVGPSTVSAGASEEESEHLPVCEIATEFAEDDPLRTIYVGALASVGVDCERAFDEADTARAVAAELTALASNRLAQYVELSAEADASSAEAAEQFSVIQALVGLVVRLAPGAEDTIELGDAVAASQSTLFDACEQARQLRRAGISEAAAALQSAAGDDCTPRISDMVDVAGVLVAAARTTASAPTPDKEAALRLLDAAEEALETSEADDSVKQPLAVQIVTLQEGLEPSDLERERNERWEALAPVLLVIGQLLFGLLLLWLAAKVVGQLQLPSRLWRGLVTGHEGAELAALGTALLVLLVLWGGLGVALDVHPLLALLLAMPVVLAAGLLGGIGRTEGGMQAGLGLLAVACLITATMTVMGDSWLGWGFAALLLAIAFVCISLVVHGPNVRLQIEDLTNDQGAGGLLRSAIREIGGTGAPVGIDRYQLPDEAIAAIPEAAGKLDASSFVNAIVSLLAKLVPDRAYRVSGDVRTIGERIELSLVLSRGRRIIDSVTLRSAVPEPADRSTNGETTADEVDGEEAELLPVVLARLALAGAVWLTLQLAETNAKNEKRPIYGSTNWESAASSAIASHELQPSDETTQRRRYAHALASDPGNWVATYGLAFLDIRSLANDQAIRRLKLTLGRLDSITRHDPYHKFRVFYQLAAAHFHAALAEIDRWPKPRTVEPTNGHLNDALRYVYSLALHELITPNSAESVGRRGQRRMKEASVGTFMRESLAGPSYALLADIHQHLGNQAAADEQIEHIENLEASQGSLSWRTHYNLACYHTNRAVVPPNASPDETDLAKALDHLALGLEGGNGLAAWATEDPSLEPLRHTRRRKFNELVQRGGVAQLAKPSLAGWGGLTEAQSEALWLLEYPDVVAERSDLMRTASSEAARLLLEEKTGVSERTLHTTALLAEVVELIEGTEPFARLLHAAQLGSIEAVRACASGQDLRDRLKDARRYQVPAAKLPAPNTAQTWIDLAQGLEPTVNPASLPGT